jgi:hypothetical protein
VTAPESLESTLVGGAPEASEPPRATGGRRAASRRVAHRAARRQAEPEPAAPAPVTTPSSPSADGRRYLGPVEGGGSQYAASAPYSRGAGFGSSYDAGGGLPAQAYRGPTAPRAITPYASGR